MEDLATTSCSTSESEHAESVPNEGVHSVDVQVVWVGPANNRHPVMLFSAECIHSLPAPLTKPWPGPYKVSFKMPCCNAKIARSILHAHGFSLAPEHSSTFDLLWTSKMPSTLDFRGLRPHQKVNHFPRSYELTMKNKLCENVHRLQRLKGFKHFNIIPKSFVLPEDADRFTATFRKTRGTWIVKPSTLSRGRGIYLVNNPSRVPTDESLVVSRYIDNPLCVDGFKFDLRLYVAVTSFEPLRAYLYEEGMARFATVRYRGPGEDIVNLCMHLTNYSVNKKSLDYVRCEDPSVEDYGNKWTLSALLRNLREDGVDVGSLMIKIEDVIIKTLICGQGPISSAHKVLGNPNCFELFGFDILIDAHLQPWVLEVNLSPSLKCDAPLDMKLKSNLVADLLSLAGIIAYTSQDRVPSYKPLHAPRLSGKNLDLSILRTAEEEYSRCGGFVRIFPTADSWSLYGSLLDSTSLNFALHKRMYPDRMKNVCPIPASLSSVIASMVHGDLEGILPDHHPAGSTKGLTPTQRVAKYLRKLDRRKKCLDSSTPRTLRSTSVPAPPGYNLSPSPSISSLPHIRAVVDHVIENADKLSKLQARQVFASYLECVQQRLHKESFTSSPYIVDSQQNLDVENSIDTVAYFLQKATRNLKASFPVTIPDKHQPLNERRQLLVKQLADFVMFYRKETIQLASRVDVLGVGSVILSANTFRDFIGQASEQDFESLLTAYSKDACCASTFLSSNPTQSHSKLKSNFSRSLDDVSHYSGREHCISQTSLLPLQKSRPEPCHDSSPLPFPTGSNTTTRSPPTSRRDPSRTCQSSGLVIKSYVSPYAHSRSKNVSEKKTIRHRPESTSSSEEGTVRKALERITQRQNGRKYSVAAFKQETRHDAVNVSSMSSTSHNTNSSNSIEYATPIVTCAPIVHCSYTADETCISRYFEGTKCFS